MLTTIKLILIILFIHSITCNLNTLKNQRLYKCNNTVELMKTLESKIDIQKFTKEYIILRIKDDNEFNLIKDNNCELIVKDLSKINTMRTSRKMFNNTIKIKDEFFNDYRSYNDMIHKLKHWEKQYKCIKLINYGRSIEGRDLIAVKISNDDKDNKAIWFNGGLHAREWISPVVVMYQIFKYANKCNQINFDLYFTPMANPDGYEFTRYGDRLWRKNRRLNNDGSYGVDLNRNFSFMWNTVGSSNDPVSEVYHGTGALSEPETYYLNEFALKINNRYAAIDWHSYGQVILRPWGHKINFPSNNEMQLKQVSLGMQKTFKEYNQVYKVDLSAGLYPAGGAMDDYMNAKLGFQAFTIELCPNDDSIGFLLHKDDIANCIEAAYHSSLTFLDFFKLNDNLLPNTNYI